MYRKFKADGIFTGYELIDSENVLITDQEGVIIDIIPGKDAGDDIMISKGILTPGFINCHCHIELSHLKNIIPRHTGLVDFVLAVMSHRNVPEERKLEAMRSAAEELYQSGTSAVGDICNNADSIAIKQNSPLYWQNFIEVSGFVDATAEERLTAAIEVLQQFQSYETVSGIRHPASVVPHAPYSVSETLFRLLNEINEAKLITIHNQEEETENELYKNKSGSFLKLYETLGLRIESFKPTGKTSFQSWLPYFTRDQKIISVHNTFISQEDIGVAKNITFCICVNANLYIENALPPLELLIKNNCSIVLGTDSYASNTQLNMLDEMKTIQKNFPSVETETILKWATTNGAEALGITDAYGSFEKGKMPGIVLIENLRNNRFSSESSARRVIN